VKYIGNPVSHGYAVGKVLLYVPYKPKIKTETIAPDEREQALGRYVFAIEQAREELENLYNTIADCKPEQANIFTAHLDILEDEVMDEEIRAAILDDLLSPSSAVMQVYERYMAVLAAGQDKVIRERVMDMEDVRNRLLRCMDGLPQQNLAMLENPVIIVTRDLLPSDTANVDREKVLAIVTEIGGATSHSAIIARSYGIPALLGVKDATMALSSGATIIVDAIDGVVITAPDENQKEEYERKKAAFIKEQRDASRYLEVEPITTDGIRIEMELNIGSDNENELRNADYTDGVGLFRTEFLYMERNSLPSEDEQTEAYKTILKRFGDKPVIIRTLDIGGDKTLACMELPAEDNPFLGKRALRLCFDRPDVFQTQLRALLRAACWGNLWIMFPMVSSVDDICRAKSMLEASRQYLEKHAIPFGTIKVGVMIEVPALAVIADTIAEQADFASIGTNDLIQYTLAADRLNPDVTEYYQPYHPSILRLIHHAAEKFEKTGKPLGVCGEMAGDCYAASLLIGLGVTRLSMSGSSIAQIKRLISRLSVIKLKETAQRALSCRSADEVKAILFPTVDGLLQN
jgi:phosphotransferase system enzyme I (PtsI)